MGISKDLLRQIERTLRPIRRSISNSIARAVVNLVNDDSGIQTVQVGVMAGENVDDAERFQQYGFSSVPLPEAEAVVLFPGGSRAHPLVVVVDDRRYRPTGGSDGDSFMYNYQGTLIRITGLEVRLGGPLAADGAIKGTARNAAEQVFLTALSTFVGAMLDAGVPSAARSTFATAIATFQAAAAAAISTKVKLE